MKTSAVYTIINVMDGNSLFTKWGTSSSNTIVPSTFSPTEPTPASNIYIWRVEGHGLTYETVTDWGDPVCMTGAKGTTGSTGTGITSITEEYYLSTSKTAQTGGSWVITAPTWSTGKYMWTRSKIIYNNPVSTAYTTPLVNSSWEAVNEIQVGGRNLLLDSEYERTASREYVSYNYLNYIYDNNGIGLYAISFDLKLDVAGSVTFYSNPGVTSTFKYLFSSETFDATTDWVRYSYIVKVYLNASASDTANSAISFYGTYGTGRIPHVKNMKVEKGNIATDWTPAPEDTQSQIDNSVKSTDVEYYLSTSSTALSGGSWLTTAPTWVDGKYMWSRTKVVLNSGTISYTPSSSGTCIAGAKGATGDKGDTGNIGTSSLGLGYKINHSTFSTANNGEIYIHGYSSTGVASDVNGFIYFGSNRISITKGMIDPNVIMDGYLFAPIVGGAVFAGTFDTVNRVFRNLSDVELSNDTYFILGKISLTQTEFVDSVALFANGRSLTDVNTELSQILDNRSPVFLGTVSSVPTDVSVGFKIITGDYFLWADGSTGIYSKGNIYEYNGTEFELSTNGDLIMGIFDSFANLANDSDTTVMGNLVVKKLVALQAFIQTLQAQLIELTDNGAIYSGYSSDGTTPPVDGHGFWLGANGSFFAKSATIVGSTVLSGDAIINLGDATSPLLKTQYGSDGTGGGTFGTPTRWKGQHAYDAISVGDNGTATYTDNVTNYTSYFKGNETTGNILCQSIVTTNAGDTTKTFYAPYTGKYKFTMIIDDGMLHLGTAKIKIDGVQVYNSGDNTTVTFTITKGQLVSIYIGQNGGTASIYARFYGNGLFVYTGSSNAIGEVLRVSELGAYENRMVLGSVFDSDNFMFMNNMDTLVSTIITNKTYPTKDTSLVTIDGINYVVKYLIKDTTYVKMIMTNGISKTFSFSNTLTEPSLTGWYEATGTIYFDGESRGLVTGSLIPTESINDIDIGDVLHRYKNIFSNVIDAITINADVVNGGNLLGQGQTWQNLTANRAKDVTYTNDTSRPIFVAIISAPDDGQWADMYINGLLISRWRSAAGDRDVTMTAIVPVGSTYKFSGSPSAHLGAWHELR